MQKIHWRIYNLILVDQKVQPDQLVGEVKFDSSKAGSGELIIHQEKYRKTLEDIFLNEYCTFTGGDEEHLDDGTVINSDYMECFSPWTVAFFQYIKETLSLHRLSYIEV